MIASMEQEILKYNRAPPNFDPAKDLPEGFFDFLLPLHRAFTPRRQELIKERARVLSASHLGETPDHLPTSDAIPSEWRIELPSWCADQRNQMTGPADDAELVVKMLNSGAPGVMLDLEDSMANSWPNLTTGMQNVLAALEGSLTYFDEKRNRTVAIQENKAAVWTRARGLHLNQAGVMPGGELVSASLFDVALVFYSVHFDRLKHPLAFYIPKSESAVEALWWRDLFQVLEDTRGLPRGYIKCMALVESHPMAYQMEEFVYNLREHLVGLNLGRWDYMASLIHFNLRNPEWVLPDRNTIPHNIQFFQKLRELLAEVCHKRGILAIGGMTALFPSRNDAELNERALRVLREDKKNEAACLMDGAWTGHPDQNEIAVNQFPCPNQDFSRRANAERYPDLRPVPAGIGKRTLDGTRAAVRTVIRYRHGVLMGKGASLLDGYMEDLATDRIYRLMIAQRMLHRDAVPIMDGEGQPVLHTREQVSALFDEELSRIVSALPPNADPSEVDKYRQAREISEQLIASGEFDPI